MNRKKRRLNYIRTKNHLRFGGKLITTFKVPIDMDLDDDHVKNTLDDIDKTLSIYKLELKHELKRGLFRDDFLFDLATIKVETSRKQ